MTTLTQQAPKVNGKRRHTFTLSATIDEATYNVFPVRDIQDPEIERAVTFAKRGVGNGDAIYTVARHVDGRITCECPDFVTRHEDKGTLCKHAECCVRMGLLDGPTAKGGQPVPTPEPQAPRLRPRDEFDPPGSPALMPVKGGTSDVAPADALSRRQASAFGIRLPSAPSKPRAASRAFAEGLLADEPTAAPASDPGPCCSPDEPVPCGACLEAADAAASFADALVDATERPALSLVEWLRLQVDFYRGFNTDAADLVAEHLAELVTEAEICQAATPGQLRDRRDTLHMAGDLGLIAHGERIGFDAGLAAADR